jgi:hypothetical protein
MNPFGSEMDQATQTFGMILKAHFWAQSGKIGALIMVNIK